MNAKPASGRVLTASGVTLHNTFAAPGVVQPAPFDAATPGGETLKLTLPPKSIVMLAFRCAPNGSHAIARPLARADVVHRVRYRTP